MPHRASPLTAIILAGSRGPDDSVAAAGGVAHKALLPLGGMTMIERMVATLEATGRFGRILIVTDDQTLFVGIPRIAGLREAGVLGFVAALSSPSLSARAAMMAAGEAWPILLTTCDQPLIEPPMIEYLLDRANPAADVSAAVVERHIVLAAMPDVRRTFWKFRAEAVSGANLFLLKGPAATGVLDFWRHVEDNRKKPLRVIGALGWWTVARVLLRAITLDGTLARLGSRTGARIEAVRLPFATACVDVDKPEDIAVAERFLADRENLTQP